MVTMEGKVNLNYLIQPLFQPSQIGKSSQDIQDHLKKKLVCNPKYAKNILKNI